MRKIAETGKIVSAQNIQLNHNQQENVAGITIEYPYSMHVTDLTVGPIPWHLALARRT